MSNLSDFNEKVVIITGSSSGIGEGIATHLSKLGAKLVITGRNKVNLKRVAENCQKVSPKTLKPLEVIADITKDKEAKSLIDSSVEHFGRIDVLINNAGANGQTSIKDFHLMDAYEKIMRVNLRSVVYLTHLAVPHLEKTKGNIINISSSAAIKPYATCFVYSMAKSSLDMFTKCLAIELGPKGVRVNSVNPGLIRTKFVELAAQTYDEMKTMVDTMTKASPLGRIGEISDVANTVSFLASSEAGFITGTTVLVDGGSIFG